MNLLFSKPKLIPTLSAKIRPIVKLKFDKVEYKRRISGKYSDTYAYLTGKKHNIKDSQVAREIEVFPAMAVGLATGMGNVGIAILFTILICAILFILNTFNFGQKKLKGRVLNITVPENLDFEGKFEDILDKYLVDYDYISVRNTSIGSLYKLSLEINMKDGASIKEFLNELRTRNGDHDISLQRPTKTKEGLLDI